MKTEVEFRFVACHLVYLPDATYHHFLVCSFPYVCVVCSVGRISGRSKLNEVGKKQHERKLGQI